MKQSSSNGRLPESTEDISKKEDFLRQDTQKSVALGMLEVCWL